MADKQDGKELLQKVRDLTSLKDDHRISKNERSALNFDNANWDMLEAMRAGVHRKQEFTCLGVPIFLRILANGEKKQILNDLLEEGLIPGTTGVWEMEFTNRTLCKASTRHPVLKDDEAPTLSLDTLDAMPDFLVKELGDAYAYFIKTLHVPVDELSEAQVKEYIIALEKKPHLLKDLPYSHVEQIMTFIIGQYQTLLQQVNKSLMPS